MSAPLGADGNSASSFGSCLKPTDPTLTFSGLDTTRTSVPSRLMTSYVVSSLVSSDAVTSWYHVPLLRTSRPLARTSSCARSHTPTVVWDTSERWAGTLTRYHTLLARTSGWPPVRTSERFNVQPPLGTVWFVPAVMLTISAPPGSLYWSGRGLMPAPAAR